MRTSYASGAMPISRACRMGGCTQVRSTYAGAMGVPGTKLRVPRSRRALVVRSRLTDRLRDRFRAAGDSVPRLVLVAAPAGFGKTTLLAQWLTAGEVRVAWISLDDGDADLRRFLTHLVAAVRVVAPEVGDESLELLQSERTVRAEDVLVGLVRVAPELLVLLVLPVHQPGGRPPDQPHARAGDVPRHQQGGDGVGVRRVPPPRQQQHQHQGGQRDDARDRVGQQVVPVGLQGEARHPRLPR